MNPLFSSGLKEFENLDNYEMRNTDNDFVKSFNDLELSLNREYNYIIQDSWTGGSGQEIFIDKTKFYHSDNLKNNDDNTLSLSVTGTRDLWEEKNSFLSARREHSAVFDPINEQMLVFGGTGPVGYQIDTFNELWSYDPASNKWTQKSSGPAAREGHTAIWNNISNLMIIFGGVDSKNGIDFKDIWKYDPFIDRWTYLDDFPFYIYDYSAVFDPFNNQMIIYGGTDDQDNSLNQTWAYDFDSNEWKEKKGYRNVSLHESVFDPINNNMLIYGGACFNPETGRAIYYNNLSAYNTDTNVWIEKQKRDIRYEHTFVLNEKSNNIFMFGGKNNSVVDELWMYNISNDQWYQLADAPQALFEHSGVWDSVNDQMLIYGGGDFNNTYIFNNKLYSYKLSVPEYAKEGFIESSTIEFLKISRLENFSVTIDSEPEACGETTVQLQIGLFESGSWNYFGPDRTDNTKFDVENNLVEGLNIDHIQKFRYKLFISSANSAYTPVVSGISFNCSHFKDEYEYLFKTIDTGNDEGKPVRCNTFESTIPEKTSISIYLSSSEIDSGTGWSRWEEIIDYQHNYTTPINRFYRIKAVLSTKDNSVTPVLHSLTLFFNEQPCEPYFLTPYNNSWVNTSSPSFKWDFNDPEFGDFQTGFRLQISYDVKFTRIFFDTGIIESTSNNYTSTKELSESTYYWHIKVRDNYKSWSYWSKPYIFYVDLTPPEAPIVYSNSNGDQERWYNNNKILLDWTEPQDNAGITGFSYTLDENPDSIPDDSIDMYVTDFRKRSNPDYLEGILEYDFISNGIWYFHIKTNDVNGHWSNTTHFKLQMDFTSPTYILDIVERAGISEEIHFNISCRDILSGMNMITLFWKYENEMDYRQVSMINSQNKSQFDFTYSLFSKADSTNRILYYFELIDKAGNCVLTRDGSDDFVEVYDDIAPQFINVNDNDLNATRLPIQIMINTKDNIDVAGARIESINNKIIFEMIEYKNNMFLFEIDKDAIRSIYKKQINGNFQFKIIIFDIQGNMNSTPEGHYYSIDLSKLDYDNTSDRIDRENSRLKLTFYFLLILTLILVIILVFLFGFYKKIPYFIRIFNTFNNRKTVIGTYSRENNSYSTTSIPNEIEIKFVPDLNEAKGNNGKDIDG